VQTGPKSVLMEELLSKHRKEQRDLQARITSKKKNATKKSRKGVNDECETLERELKERQKAELDALNGEEIANGVDGVDLNQDDQDDPSDKPESEATPPVETISSDITTTAPPHTSSTTTPPPRKRNRQKDRLARRLADQESAIAAASSEAASMPDARSLELESMASHLSALHLSETPIRPDGHCLYSAIASSLPATKVKNSGPYDLDYQNVRYTAAKFISEHADDFAAFLEEPVEVYTRKVRETAEWGGAVELQALARAYGRRINVLQSDGRVERIGETEGEGQEEVWLAYYRHSFGLGEHYNALKKKE
jgi:OTU domain-containing protein 6